MAALDNVALITTALLCWSEDVNIVDRLMLIGRCLCC